MGLCVVLSRFGNAIDSGTGKPGAVTSCLEGIPPEGDGGAAQARQGVARVAEKLKKAIIFISY